MRIGIGVVAVAALLVTVFPNNAEGCPYLQDDETVPAAGTAASLHHHSMVVPPSETVHHTRGGGGGVGASTTVPRLPVDDVTYKRRHLAKLSFRERLRKFLNRFDFFNLFPNPKTPAAPTKAPFVPSPPTTTTVPAPTAGAIPPPTMAPRVMAPVAPPVTPPVTAQLIAAAKVEIQTLSRDGGHAGKLVQLAFHDCVGGCDGCVDLDDLANKGLDVPIDVLKPIVTKYTTNTSLTRADIWALAGLAAAEASQRTLEFTLTQVGRPVCANMTGGPKRVLPSAHFSTQQVLDYFATHFRFSKDETVAIMGAHSLGRAKRSNSGFDGPFGWDSAPDTMDNGYFTTLVSTTTGTVQTAFKLEQQFNSWYTQTQQFPDHFLWRLQGRIFMINADMAMAVNLAGYLDPVTGAVNCSLGDSDSSLPLCPKASTLGASVNYARNQTAWVHDFRNAYTKMLSTGCNTNIYNCTAV